MGKYINILAIVCSLVIPFSASAASSKKSVDSQPLTDEQLHDLARQELRKEPQPLVAPTAKNKKNTTLQPLEAPAPSQEALVSTADVLREERNLVLPDAELEVGTQSYLPQGIGHVSNAETYSLRLKSSPMLLLGFRKWFYDRPMNDHIAWRAGASVGVGVTSHETETRAQNNVLYNDIMLRTILTSVGPEAEIFLNPRRSLAFGSRFAVGRMYSVQAAPDPRLNRSENLNYWESTAYLRFQPFRNFFLKGSYARRNMLGQSEGLIMQQDNWAASIGYAL